MIRIWRGTMKELFSIGEMAELFQVNIRTLRYYDEIGLLKPETVNQDTGYRYYSTKQFERLNTIKYLRTLNMPLDKMKQFFEKKEVRKMDQILEEQLEATREQLKRLQNMERRLERRLGELRYARTAPLGEIREVEMQPRRAAYLRRQIRQGENLEYPIRDLERSSRLKSAVFLGKVGVSIGMEDLKRREFSRFSGIFVFLEEEEGDQSQCRLLPGGTYLAILYSGTHQESSAYYERLLDYMKTRGLALAGDSVEITWIDAGFTEDLGQYVTELQIPVKYL